MIYLQMGVIFLIGTLLGSFINVCIYRLPRKESIVWSRSCCPNCKYQIPIWKNIPLISYLILRGKCSNCKTPISKVYPLVEALTGLLLVLVWYHYGLTSSFVYYTLLVLFLLPISFIDLDTQLILNVLTLPGMIVGLSLSQALGHISIAQSFLGLLLGGGFLWSISLIGEFIFKKESMGGGDIKLGAMIGTFLGAEVIIVLFLAFFLALPVIAVGLGTKRLNVGSKLPFGPFISLGAIIIVCFGSNLYQYYFALMEKF